MSKTVTEYKEVTVRRPSKWQYTCDTCGYVFEKGERKVAYSNSGVEGKLYACNDKPCSPFSNPEGYEYEWDTEKQDYKWVKSKPKENI